jgi:hypothetical protein
MESTYRVWTMWTDRSEHLIDLKAPCADEAVRSAVRMGLTSGLGLRRAYNGCHAVRIGA